MMALLDAYWTRHRDRTIQRAAQTGAVRWYIDEHPTHRRFYAAFLASHWALLPGLLCSFAIGVIEQNGGPRADSLRAVAGAFLLAFFGGVVGRVVIEEDARRQLKRENAHTDAPGASPPADGGP